MYIRNNCSLTLIIPIVFTLFGLSGCVGYSTYGPGASTFNSDDGELIYDVTGENNALDYRQQRITKTDVITAWGKPENISIRSWNINEERFDNREYWKYKRDISFGGFAPTIIFPIPIFWWPSGYYTTTVVFRDERVVRLYKQSGEFRAGYTCVLPIFCWEGEFRLH